MDEVKDDNAMSSSPSTFLNELDSNDLKIIQYAFEEYAKNNKEPVTKEIFVQLLRECLSKGNDDDFYEVFEMIDISRDRFITWDTFSSYLMLEYCEMDDRTKTTQIPKWFNSKQIQTPHKAFICQMIVVQNSPNCYYTISRDGLFCILNNNFQIKDTYQIIKNPEEIKAKDLWVTDATYLSNASKIAFTTTSREILIYEVNGNNKSFACNYKICGLKFIPMCIMYWVNPNNTKVSILAYGDTGGYLHVLLFDHINNGILFENGYKGLVQSENGQKLCIDIDIANIKNGSYSTIKYLTHNGHGSWVRNIRYSPLLDCFISCTTDSKDSLILAWLGKGRRNFRLTKFNVGLGVTSFDYHEKLNLIATGGIDNMICLWNPYVVAKPIGILRGHIDSIICVRFIKVKNLILSFSKDKVLRIWDVTLQICLQRLTSIFVIRQHSSDYNIQLTFDQDNLLLLASINANLNVLKMRCEIQDKILSHDHPITDLVYNDKLGQIVSVCEGSTITIWYLNTGQKVKSITNAHSNSEITAVTLDYTKTRILTAATDGLIKIWDINGTCYHVLIVANNQPYEITQIVCLKRSILAVGWSKVLCLFDTHSLTSYYVQPVHWKGRQKHYDDIFTLIYHEPKTLFTASYDGDIVLWNTTSHNPIRKLYTVGDNSKKIVLPAVNNLNPVNLVSQARTNPMNLVSQSSANSESRTQELSSRASQGNSRGSSRARCNSSKSKKESDTISSVCLLKSRDCTNENTADLFVSHTSGMISFWNTLTCKRIDTLNAFTFTGSIVSAVDAQDHVIGVGSETGLVKLFDISQFCNEQEVVPKKNLFIKSNLEEKSELDTGVTNLNELNMGVTNPNDKKFNSNYKLMATLFHHDDVITCIRFIETLDLLFIVSASSDCTIALHCCDQLIGVFGSEKHWNLNDLSSAMFETLSSTINKIPGRHDEDKPRKNGHAKVDSQNKDAKQIENNDTDKTFEQNNKNGNRENFNESLSLLSIQKNNKLPSNNDVSASNLFTIRNELNNNVDISNSSNVIIQVDEQTTFKTVNNSSCEQASLNTTENNALLNVEGFEDTWTSSVLGKTYQEARSHRRDRKHGHLKNSGNIMTYQFLNTNKMAELNKIEKPDFVTHPEKYFLGFNEESSKEEDKVDSFTLHTIHNEKSIFPKSIRDLELKKKTAFSFASGNHSKLSSRKSRASTLCRTESKATLPMVNSK